MAISTDIGILLYITAAVLKFYDRAVLVVYSINGHIGGVVDMMYRVIDQSRWYAVDTCYRVVIGLAVVAFFAAGIADGECDEQEKNRLFHKPK